MPDYAGEKTLEPTPHRRQQARREGHVAKSHDLGSAGLLLAGLAVLVMLGGGLVGFLVEYCRSQLGGEPWLVADADFAVSQWNATLWALGRYLLPILGLALPGRRGGQRASNRLSVLAAAVGLRLCPARSAARAAAHFLRGQHGPPGFRHCQTARSFSAWRARRSTASAWRSSN